MCTTARTHCLWLGLLVAGVFLAYTPAIQGLMVWDDEMHIAHPAVMDGEDGLQKIWFEKGATPQYYPLTYSAFWVQRHWLWGDRVAGYHLTNVLCHCLSAALLFFILRRLNLAGALFAAAVFALHSVHVESVAWMSELKNCLSGLFYLSALLCYLRFTNLSEGRAQRNWFFYASSLFLFILALLSKTVTCSLPATLLLLQWWKNGRIGRRDLWPLLPYFVLGIVLGLQTAGMEKQFVKAEGAEWDFSFLERTLIAGRALWFYVGKLLLPIRQAFIYPRWVIDSGQVGQYVYPLLAILTALGAFLWRKQIGRGPLVAMLIFGGTLFPALGFVNVYPMRYSFVADHFQYLASIAMIALWTALGDHWIAQRTRLKWAVGIFLVLLLSIKTWSQAHAYQSELILWEKTFAYNPNNKIVLNNYGVELNKQGRYREALPLFLRAQTIPLTPEDQVRVKRNIADSYIGMGQAKSAIDYYRQTVTMAPTHAHAWAGLGRAYAMQNRYEQSVAPLEKAVHLAPRQAFFHYCLAVVRYELQDYQRAFQLLETANVLQPNTAEHDELLSRCLFQQKAYRQARQAAARAHRLAPNLLEPIYLLAFLMERQGNIGAFKGWLAKIPEEAPNALSYTQYKEALVHHGKRKSHP